MPLLLVAFCVLVGLSSWRRLSAMLWLSSVLCALGVVGCIGNATEVVLRPIPKERIREVCWRPAESSAKSDYFVFDGDDGKIVSDEDENAFALAVNQAGLIYHYDENASAKSLTLIPLTRPDAWCNRVPKPTDDAVKELLDPCSGQTAQEENRAVTKNLIAQTEITPRSTIFCRQRPQMWPTPQQIMILREKNKAYLDAFYQAQKIANALTQAEADMQAVINKSDSWLKSALTSHPGTIEQIQQRLADALDSIEAPPVYINPILDSIAVAGFVAGFDKGKFEVEAKLFAIDAGVMLLEFAALEVALGPLGGAKFLASAASKGAKMLSFATTKGGKALATAMERLENIPIFIPTAAGGGGGFVRVGAVTGAIAAWKHRYLLENALKAKPFNLVRKAGQALHHIVAHGDGRATKARKILDKFKINIDEGWNGVFLPATKNSPNPKGSIVHSMVHSNDYYFKVENFLLQATSRKDAIRKLQRIRETLENGTFFDVHL